MLRFGALGLQVPGEGVLEGHVVLVAARPPIVFGRVPPDVDQEQIEPAVAVVVEEHRRRRMPDVVEARRPRRCRVNLPVAVVLEQHVAAAHGRHVEVGVAVVVDVGERGRDADLARRPPTPADAVMSSNLPPPRFLHSWLPPTWLTK